MYELLTSRSATVCYFIIYVALVTIYYNHIMNVKDDEEDI